MSTTSTHEGLSIGPVRITGKAFLAPMSGVSDLPFRTLAHEYGAGLVVSEMIASEALVNAVPEMTRKAQGADHSPLVIQLAGREAHWMAEGARVAAGLGANMIDINMGCPAKQVTRGLSGSALMRDLDHAARLIESVVEAVDIPVTLKMRTGWDEQSRNAPTLAARAEAIGVQMITVHGRTRCQFYNGHADWSFIRQVKAAVGIPVVANGDVLSVPDCAQILAESGADAVMIGRGSYGAPWLPGHASQFLATGEAPPALSAKEICDLAGRHYDMMLSYYGVERGRRNARKHLGWYVERLACKGEAVGPWRARLCRAETPGEVHSHLQNMCDDLGVMAA